LSYAKPPRGEPGFLLAWVDVQNSAAGLGASAIVFSFPSIASRFIYANAGCGRLVSHDRALESASPGTRLARGGLLRAMIRFFEPNPRRYAIVLLILVAALGAPAWSRLRPRSPRW